MVNTSCFAYDKLSKEVIYLWKMVKHSDLSIKLGKEQVIYLSTIVNHGDYLLKAVQQMWFTYDKLSTEVIYLWTNVKNSIYLFIKHGNKKTIVKPGDLPLKNSERWWFIS